MQRDGLIVFALLLTLAVLAPQGTSQSEAVAQTDSVAPLAPLSLSRSETERPAMSLATPDSVTEKADCEASVLRSGDSDHHNTRLRFRLNVSI